MYNKCVAFTLLHKVEINGIALEKIFGEQSLQSLACNGAPAHTRGERDFRQYISQCFL